jgi:hypothetical protein
MTTTTLSEMFEREEQLFESVLAEVKQMGKKSIHVDDLYELVMGCVTHRIPIKIIPLDDCLVSISL